MQPANKFRCIIFGAAFPFPYMIPSGNIKKDYMGEGDTAETAMFAALVEICGEDRLQRAKWVQGGFTWQPARNTTYLDGFPCGVVFELPSKA